MADINVERKGPSIWPWIIGLIVLALLVWFLADMFMGNDEEEVVVTDPATVEVVEPVQPAPQAQPVNP